jgi:F420H(2)-dependent quinone reductase
VSRVPPAVRPPLRLLRLGNPVVRAVLGSRAHRLLSGRLLVLDYRGRRTGRQYRIPLRYAEIDTGELVAVAVRPERKQWWRSFAEPTPAAVLLRGTTVDVVGALASDETRAGAVARYDAANPRGARWTGDAAVVVFTPSR